MMYKIMAKYSNSNKHNKYNCVYYSTKYGYSKSVYINTIKN